MGWSGAPLQMKRFEYEQKPAAAISFIFPLAQSAIN